MWQAKILSTHNMIPGINEFDTPDVRNERSTLIFGKRFLELSSIHNKAQTRRAQMSSRRILLDTCFNNQFIGMYFSSNYFSLTTFNILLLLISDWKEKRK